MYTLRRENVERTVLTEIEKDRLLAKGFALLEAKEENIHPRTTVAR